MPWSENQNVPNTVLTPRHHAPRIRRVVGGIGEVGDVAIADLTLLRTAGLLELSALP